MKWLNKKINLVFKHKTTECLVQTLKPAPLKNGKTELECEFISDDSSEFS